MASTHPQRLSATILCIAGVVLIAAARAHAQQITTWTATQEGPAITAVLGRAVANENNRSSFELSMRFDTPVHEDYLVRLEAGKASWRFSGYEYLEPRTPGFARDRPGVLASDRVSITRVTASVIRRHLQGPTNRTSFYAGGGIGGYYFRSDERRRPYSQPWRLGIHAIGGFEAPLPNTRFAITGEVQAHLPGVPWESVADTLWFSILNASIGLKIRM